MASPLLVRNAHKELYVCARCSFKTTKIQRRWIGMKYMKKAADAEAAWQQKAVRIRNGELQGMLDILDERGLVHQVAG